MKFKESFAKGHNIRIFQIWP